MTGHVEARRLLSLDLDGELDPGRAAALRSHLDTCDACAHHELDLLAVRDALRADLDAVPDVRAAVLAAIAAGSSPPAATAGVVTAGPAGATSVPDRAVAGHPAVDPARGRRWIGWLPAAACLVAGLLLGSALVGGWRGTSPPVAAQVPAEIAAAQFGVRSLSAGIEISEWGWNPQVPVRTFAGTIDYEAPGSLALHLDDTTAYPSASWVPADVDLVVHEDQWWARGPRDCPSPAQPGCTAPEPELEVIDAIEPFDDGAPVPLDLVVPVGSFLRSPQPTVLGATTIDGRPALGVEVTAAQVAPLLDGLRPAGNLRRFFPTDVVALWLDAGSWTPLRVDVDASTEPERRTWAINRGYTEQPGDRILTVAVRGPRVNEGIDRGRLVPAPEGGVRRDAGFVPAERAAAPGRSSPEDPAVAAVDPARIPAGMAPATAGSVRPGGQATSVRTWVGGRGWIKVEATRAWDGDRLFGDLGSPVRRLDGPDGWVGYASLDGTRVGVHGDGIDVVVTGSVDEDVLVAVAQGLDVRGVVVPEHWSDAATETIGSATELLPGLLVPDAGPGYESAAVRADGNVVTQAYAGAGGRGFVVVEAPGERLSPPLDMDTAGVVVRGIDGRYSATRGELEWVEGERVHRLTSTTLSRAELLAIAASMDAA